MTSMLPNETLTETNGSTGNAASGGTTATAQEKMSRVVRRGGVAQGTLGPGEYFGEIALLHSINRTATVVALSDVRVATMEASEFLDSLASSETAYGIAWRTTSDTMNRHNAQTET